MRAGLRSLAVGLAGILSVIGCQDQRSVRDLSAGPLLNGSIGESVSWCEELEPQDVLPDSAEDKCIYKYLENGIRYWSQYASVAFVADIEPDCEGGVQRFCLPWALGEDCLEFCPMKVGQTDFTLFGDPDQIETLAAFGSEVWEFGGRLVDVYLLDGDYPSSRWTISPGSNLIFAHRACYANRYVGYDGLFLVTGIFPVDGDIVFDVENVSTTLPYLAEKISSLTPAKDESEDYARRCGIESSSAFVHKTADDGQSMPECVLDPKNEYPESHSKD